MLAVYVLWDKRWVQGNHFFGPLVKLFLFYAVNACKISCSTDCVMQEFCIPNNYQVNK